MSSSLDLLSLNRPQPTYETVNGNALQNTTLIRQKLLEELVELERQKQKLELQNSQMDFSMLQTYKEMIHSRRIMFNELNR